MNNELHNIPQKILVKADTKIHHEPQQFLQKSRQPFDYLKIAIHNKNPKDIFFSTIGGLGIILILSSYFIQFLYFITKQYKYIPKSIFYTRILGLILSSIFIYFENIASLKVILLGLLTTFTVLALQIYKRL